MRHIDIARDIARDIDDFVEFSTTDNNSIIKRKPTPQEVDLLLIQRILTLDILIKKRRTPMIRIAGPAKLTSLGKEMLFTWMAGTVVILIGR